VRPRDKSADIRMALSCSSAVLNKGEISYYS
jgi:hypothetical protein